jgi:predicted phage baseplate assembly protein
MEFESPRLDDRAFDDLVAEARQRIALYTPEWTDHNLSDPGMTLIELFAFMTDVALYRMNRVPDKHYVKLMGLLGMSLREAEPARVPVTFWLSAPQPVPIIIPSGTEVATTRTETENAIVFSTDGPADIIVPRLAYFLTSSSDKAERRVFNNYNAGELSEGRVSATAFVSEPPTTGDAFYLGFTDDISHHILGIDIEVPTAAGSGIDPNSPPYVWEVLSNEANQSWLSIEVETDETKALNVSGMIRVYLPQMRRAPRDDKMAYWVRCRLDTSRNPQNYTVSPTITRLQTAGWGVTINTTHVTRATNEVLGRSDGTPGQTFFLQNVPVVARSVHESIAVKNVDGREELWQEIADFATSTPDDKHYTINSQSGEVRFGPAMPQRDGTIHRYGAIPAQNSMLMMRQYRYGGGTIGNVAANAINILKTSIPYIQRVVNRQSAQGGLDAEDVNNAKTRVPGYLRTLNRAVTAQDFEYLAEEAAPGQVGRVFCLQPPLTSRGEINILVIPSVTRLQSFISPESLHLSNELRERITQYLDERRLLSTRLQVMEPSYQWVETDVRLRVSRHQDPEKVRQAVEKKLFEFINPVIGGADGKGWQFGRDLYLSDIMAILLTVPGVDFIRAVRLYPMVYQDGDFVRGQESQEIPVVSHGVVISYRHNITMD